MLKPVSLGAAAAVAAGQAEAAAAVGPAEAEAADGPAEAAVPLLKLSKSLMAAPFRVDMGAAMEADMEVDTEVATFKKKLSRSWKCKEV